MNLSYAGIGSRRTPDYILNEMTEIAIILSKEGYVLNSGGAPGADQAFEKGSLDKHKIFVPWNGFSGQQMLYQIPSEAFEIASGHHPAWSYLKDSVKRLMARNVMQVLGQDLKTHIEFLICWTPDSCMSHKTRNRDTGGTGLAISVASLYKIPIFNMCNNYCRNFVLNDLIRLIDSRKEDKQL